MFIIAQIISLAVARYIPERFFCWAPYDEHTYINVNVEINVSNEIVYEDDLTFIANSNTSSNINKSKSSIILLYNFDAIVGFNFRKKYI